MPGSARLRFGEPHAADAWLGVRRARDVVLIYGDHWFTGNVPDSDHTFGGRYMRELRRARDDIPDGVNPGLAGALIGIHFDEPTIPFDLGSFQSDIFGVRFAADRDQQRVCRHRLGLSVGQRHLEPYAAPEIFHVFYASAALP